MVEIENIKNLKKHIRYKLTDYKRGDKIKTEKFPEKNKNLKTITVDDAVNLIETLETDICKGCSCKILFCGYIPFIKHSQTLHFHGYHSRHTATMQRMCLHKFSYRL